MTAMLQDRGSSTAAGVEANARLTGTSGLVLLVLLAVEGFTVLSVRQFISWHLFVGLLLIPPILVKFGSTFWRFSRYYLGDPAYRRAGPPVPLLRLAGPIVVLTTITMFGSGVLLLIEGQGHDFLLTVHKASFILWFVVMAVHVLAHTLRASRLARADLQPAAPGSRRVPGRQARQGLVAAGIVAGVILAVASDAATNGWSKWAHHLGDFGRFGR